MEKMSRMPPWNASQKNGTNSKINRIDRFEIPNL